MEIRKHNTRRLAAISGAAFVALIASKDVAFAGPGAPPPARVASVTVCGDEYLALLADRAQIASVSDKAFSPLARYPDRLRGLPRNRRDVEELVSENLDLVLIEPGDRRLPDMLKRMGVRTVLLPSASQHRIADVESGLRRIAAALGHPERAEPVIADLEARVAKLKADQPPTAQRPVAVYVRPEGGGAGGNTFIDTTLTLGGFRNLQALAGQKGWKRMDLEDVAQHPPDAYVTSFFDTQRNVLSAVRGRNPLLGRSHAPVIPIPGRLWVCSSPSVVAAAEALRDARLKTFPGGIVR